MNNYIFYFSGTGNSLSIAKQICARTQNTELISITNQIESGYEIEDADTIGFVLPVYLFGAPLIAEEFIKKLKIKRHKYLYVLFVHGGAPYSAVNNFKSKLNDAGLKVDAGFEIVSPDNYIAGNNPPNIEEARDILSKSKEELNKVIEEMKNRENSFPKISLRKNLFGTLMRPSFKGIASKAAQKFITTNDCNACGTCVKLCPRGIISINENNRPEWIGSNCEMCFSCINLCPKKAIEIGKKTEGRNRYKNPEVTITELTVRKNEP
ncbi:MAG: 4Fe-4S binding protein [Clostridia bacterium]|jgi:ferredoxin|nr:4Fe-4S binding protein [Clostridia bacterium]